jgi:hypothetical protein
MHALYGSPHSLPTYKVALMLGSVIGSRPTP